MHAYMCEFLKHANTPTHQYSNTQTHRQSHTINTHTNTRAHTKYTRKQERERDRERDTHTAERWGAGVETQKNVRGEVGGWGRVPFNEPYAPSLSTIYDGA